MRSDHLQHHALVNSLSAHSPIPLPSLVTTIKITMMISQGGLTEAQLEDLGTKGKAGLGEALGPLVVSLANEYKEVIRSFVEPWP